MYSIVVRNALRRPILGSLRQTNRAFCATELGKTEKEQLALLQAEIETAENKLEELKDKFDFQKQDLDNAKRRHLQALEDAGKYAITKFAKEVISIADNLERAKQSLKIEEIDESTPNAEGLRRAYEGVYRTETLLKEVLLKHSIEKFDPMGKKYDPNLCEAMFRMPVPGVEPNSVVHVMETGYMIHERVLRAARVGTSQ